jgi:hypothetical protein
MRITVDLSTDEAIALRRFAKLHYPLPMDEAAAALALREYLVGTGDLELMPTIDETARLRGAHAPEGLKEKRFDR